MAAKLRIFLSFSFTDDTKEAVAAFKEIAESNGFTVVTGEPPGGASPPEFVRSRILSCDCFAAIMTSTDVKSRASAWISNEIGMAYALDLPLMICPEDTVDDLGLAKMATSYNDFSRDNLGSFKSGLAVYFREIKQDKRIKEGSSLGNFINNLARAALSGHTPSSINDAATISKLTTLVDTLAEGSRLHMFSFGESDEFTEKRREHLVEKQAIAKYVTDHFLKAYADRDDAWIFMDSGTATYTICEELVANALQIPVMTNNLASCRTLSVIPAYPLFVVPGEMETRYVASLGDECISFVRDVMSRTPQERPVQLALIAATSVTSNIGICGNDPRHNELKKTLLEKSPESLVVFEGEKLLHKNGVAIFKSRDNWREFAANCNDGRTVRLITHYPEHFSQLSMNQRKLFETEVAKLKEMFGPDNVVVLGTEKPEEV